MKLALSAATLLSLASKSEATCTVSLTGDCSVDAALTLFQGNTDCAGEVTADNLPADLCSVAFGEVANEFYQFDKNYMDGGGDLNDFSDDVKTLELQAARILRFQQNVATTQVVAWPEYDALAGLPDINNGQFYRRPGYMSNFDLENDNCSTNAVMCCFTSDRDGTDADANATPFADNTDVCAHDLAESAESNHVKSGWAAYKGSETNTFCHGFYWPNDDTADASVYKGNTLFAASYLTTVTKGYTKNIPGAPMCACVDQMPIVSYAQCLKPKVTKEAQVTYIFTYEADGSFSTSVDGVTVEMEDCGDLTAAYTAEADLTAEQKKAFSSKVLGDSSGCGDAEDDFLNEYYFVPGQKGSPVSNPDQWQQFVGERTYHMSMPGETGFRALYDSSATGIIYRYCSSCDSGYRHLYYRRITPFPDDFEALDMLMNSFIEENNKVEVDFQLWDNYADALARNAATSWKVCGYDANNDGLGFPGTCGFDALDTRQNFNSYDPRRTNGRANYHAFYVDVSGSS